MSCYNWRHVLPSSCLHLTIVIAYWLDYRNQRLLLFNVCKTLLHVWCWIYVLESAYQMVFVSCESRIQFKLWLLMHLIHTGRCPSYFSETIQLVADHASRKGLRSASNQDIQTRLRTVFGERFFSFSGPKAWNALSDRFHSIESTDSFKKQLKTPLFNHFV